MPNTNPRTSKEMTETVKDGLKSELRDWNIESRGNGLEIKSSDGSSSFHVEVTEGSGSGGFSSPQS